MMISNSQVVKANPKMDAALLNGITKGWLQLITPPNTGIDRRAYTFCTLERLCERLRRNENFLLVPISVEVMQRNPWYNWEV